jgi:hypothetical protein
MTLLDCLPLRNIQQIVLVVTCDEIILCNTGKYFLVLTNDTSEPIISVERGEFGQIVKVTLTWIL